MKKILQHVNDLACVAAGIVCAKSSEVGRSGLKINDIERIVF